MEPKKNKLNELSSRTKNEELKKSIDKKTKEFANDKPIKK